MSNRRYYEFEAELVGIIRESDADTVRGALAGAVRNSAHADFVRSLYERLRQNAFPDSEFRKRLDALRESATP